jgi:hypothetical protein
MDYLIAPLDRARRVVSWSNFGLAPVRIAPRFYTNFWVFFSIFKQYFGFFFTEEGLFEKVNSSFDRARRVLSLSNVDLTWSKCRANPFKKYANPDLRYSTYQNMENYTTTVSYFSKTIETQEKVLSLIRNTLANINDKLVIVY